MSLVAWQVNRMGSGDSRVLRPLTGMQKAVAYAALALVSFWAAGLAFTVWMLVFGEGG